MRTYAVGDIHGMSAQLIAMLAKIKADACDIPFKIVFLGDYVDRGPDSKGVIDILIQLRDHCYPSWHDVSYEPIFLKGNHEDLMLDALADRDPMGHWVGNGGNQTVLSYKGHEVPESHRYFLQMDLELFYEDDKTFFCHAGINPDRPLNNQHEKDLLWIREYFLHRKGNFPKFIVHGHTPWVYDRYRERNESNRLNLDSGCFYSGDMTAAVFVDDRAFASDYRLLTVQGDGAPGFSKD